MKHICIKIYVSTYVTKTLNKNTLNTNLFVSKIKNKKNLLPVLDEWAITSLSARKLLQFITTFNIIHIGIIRAVKAPTHSARWQGRRHSA